MIFVYKKRSVCSIILNYYMIQMLATTIATINTIGTIVTFIVFIVFLKSPNTSQYPAIIHFTIEKVNVATNKIQQRISNTNIPSFSIFVSPLKDMLLLGKKDDF